MSRPFLVFFAILFWNSLLVQTKENIEFKELRNNKSCRDHLFSFDDKRLANRSLRAYRKLRSGNSLDCFGLGSQFADTLDWFLKKEANGTMAQKVKFYISTRGTPDKVTLRHGENFEAEGVDFDIMKRTMLIVHGFLSNGDEDWIKNMTRAFLKWDDVNVIVVDWSDGSNTWNYYKAAVNTRTVGNQIATFLSQLAGVDSKENYFGHLHFIGHSLGAHICGFAAQELKRRNHPWLPLRITGLDPAQPCFRSSDKYLRLDEGDAPFVDIIHTNGRVLSRLGLGLPEPLGHVDFYPNGGKIQPGCILKESFLWKYLPLPIKQISETVCSHGRSYLYFIDSVLASMRNECTFWAHQWDLSYDQFDMILRKNCNREKCVEMGINAENYSFNGTFLTITGKTNPFCRTDRHTIQEVKEIIGTVKRKLHCDSGNSDPKNEILIEYN